MQSHDDLDAKQARALRDLMPEGEPRFLKRLQDRATSMTKRNTITAGYEGEVPVQEWETTEMRARRLPDDEQEIVRISIGGVAGRDDFDYLVFRGDPMQVRGLLLKAKKTLNQITGR